MMLLIAVRLFKTRHFSPLARADLPNVGDSILPVIDSLNLDYSSIRTSIRERYLGNCSMLNQQTSRDLFQRSIALVEVCA